MHLGDIRARRRPQVTPPFDPQAFQRMWANGWARVVQRSLLLGGWRWCRGPDIGRGGSTPATRGEQPNGVDLDVVFQLR
ncbi:hypothetical protein CEP53_009138 [Fusarium sp. AF-6]|nr:hypothetical protein CEP53_009138 [Fusarium sp. AF-6]